eukprot:s2411_g5.t1
MADLAADKCVDAHNENRFFSLEHPARSLAQYLQSWQRLLGPEGVFVVYYTTCMFEGSRRKKNQMLICNHPVFKEMGLSCKGGSVCDRTGLKHLKWRPTTSGGRVVQFTTGDEREYPSGFCTAYARCAAKILGSKGTFMEVFSGPNAPLTRAMCQQLGEELRGTRLSTEKGLKVELQRLSQVMDASDLVPASRGQERNAKGLIADSLAAGGRIPDVSQTPEALTNRLAMLEASRQPSYGKRGQLIPDGLSSQRDHLERALRLTHPFDTLQVLKVDHLQILEQQTISEKDLNLLRLRVLADWRTLSSSEEVRKLQDRHEGLACENAKRLGRKPRTALMEILGERYRLEDALVPRLCLTGMPIVGAALESPFFDQHEIPPTITIAELLASAPSRRQEVLRRVEFMSKKAGEPQAKADSQGGAARLYGRALFARRAPGETW